MTSGCVMVASTRSFREHRGHVRTSNPKDLFISVAQSTYLARAKSSPLSRRPQWATVIMVGSTSTTGSADACASDAGPGASPFGGVSVYAGEQGATAAGGAGDAGAGDAGDAGDAGAGDAGPGAFVDADAGAVHAFDKGARPGGFGVTSARHDERGANTPW